MIFNCPKCAKSISTRRDLCPYCFRDITEIKGIVDVEVAEENGKKTFRQKIYTLLLRS